MTDLQQYFDKLQPKYYINEIASLGFTKLFRKMAVRKIEDYGGKRVLDLMSGQGENLKFLEKHNEKTKIITLDFSSVMNQKLLSLYENRYSIKQIQSDFFQSKIPNKSIDIILCSYGTKTIENEKVEFFADELSRIIDNNGEIIIVEFVKPKIKWRLHCVKWYIEVLVAKLFGKEFKELFYYIDKNKSLFSLKKHFFNNDLSIMSHKRYFDLVEILHVKRI
jgi:demethylmenaquinone methyltransferase/2-methoxy-6-polyprenyl-1,4-benzoquinol methylase